MNRTILFLVFFLIPSLALSATDRRVAIYPSGASTPSGYDATYTSMSTMEAAENGDLTDSGGTRLVVEITSSDGTWESAPDTTNTIFDGWTCDYSNGEYIWIYTVDGAKPSSPMFWDETAYIKLEGGIANNTTIDNDHAAVDIAVVFQNIQFVNSASSSTWSFFATTGGYLDTLIIDRCYVWNHAPEEGGIRIENPAASGSAVQILNTVLHGADGATAASQGLLIESGAANATVHAINNTIAHWNIGIHTDDSSAFYSINNALLYNSDDFRDTSPSGYPLNCASDEGAGEGTNGIDLTPGTQATDLAVTFVQPVESANLVSNGGFETCSGCTPDDSTTDDFANWTENDDSGSGYIDWDSNEAVIPEGTYVVDIHKGAGSDVNVNQSFALSASTTYVFSYIGKSDGTGTVEVSIRYPSESLFLQEDGSWSTNSNWSLDYIKVDTSDTAWAYQYLVFTTPGYSGSYNVMLINDQANSSSWVDDVQVYAWPRVDYRLTGDDSVADLLEAGETQDNEALVPSLDILGRSRATGANRPDIGAFEHGTLGASLSRKINFFMGGRNTTFLGLYY